MLIKLTNASPDFKDSPLLLNTDSVVSVSRGQITRQLDEDNTLTETVTFVFCPPHGTWEVVETVEEISQLINTGK